MGSSHDEHTTSLLADVARGDRSQLDRLFERLYPDFRRLAASMLRRRAATGSPMDPTPLVHELYMRLIDQRRVDWQGRAHFFAVAAKLMRRILVDHARKAARLRRGGGHQRIRIDDTDVEDRRDAEVLAIDEALDRLAQLDERQAQIVELRYFGGLTVEEVADVLGTSKRTVEAEWTACRAWLRRELAP